MGFVRRIAGFLGIGGGAHEEVKEGEGEGEVEESSSSKQGGGGGCPPTSYQETGLPCRGFSVPVQVSVDHSPLLVPCSSRDGGVQGLRWYAKRLRVDEDGDVAHEFLLEVLPDVSSSIDAQQKQLPKFEVKYRTRPAKIRSQMMSLDGKIQQCIEHEGKLQWT